MNPTTISPWIGYLVLFVVLIGVVLDIMLFTKKRTKTLAGISSSIPWNVRDFILVILFYVFYLKAFDLFLSMCIENSAAMKQYENISIWVINFIAGGATVVFLICHLKDRYGITSKELGFASPIQLKYFFQGFLFYWAAIPPLILTALFTKMLAGYFKIPLEPQIPLQLFVQETVFWKLGLMAVFIVVAAPLFEEIFFRGFFYPLLKKMIGMRWAMLGSAVLFSSIHFNFFAFLPICCIGLFLAYLYEKTGSLFSSIAFHSLNNLAAVLIITTTMK